MRDANKIKGSSEFGAIINEIKIKLPSTGALLVKSDLPTKRL